MLESSSTRPKSGARRFVAVTVASLMLMALLPAAVALAAPTVTTLATANVSADTAVSGYAAIPGPAISEAAAGELANGTIVLDLPDGFQFNSASGSITKSPAGCTLTVSSVSMATGTASITISGAPSTGTPCTLTFNGLQVKLTSGDVEPPPSGNITNTGTAGAPNPGNYGTLTGVPGAAILSYQAPLTSTSATAGTVLPLAA